MDKMVKRSYFVVILSIPAWIAIFFSNFLFSIFFKVDFPFDLLYLIYIPLLIMVLNAIFIKFKVLGIIIRDEKNMFRYTRLLFIALNGCWATYICVNQPDIYNGFAILFTFLLGLIFSNRMLDFKGTVFSCIIFFLIFLFMLKISGTSFGNDEKLLCYFFGYSAIIFGIGNGSTIKQIKKERELIKIQKNYAKDLELEVEEKTNNVNTLIENLDQGFMVLNKEGLIQNGATKATINLFGEDPANKKMADLLKLNRNENKNFKTWLYHAFSGRVPFKDLVDLAPKKFKNLENKFINLDYKPVYRNGNKKEIIQIICIATDITEKINFEKEVRVEKEKAKQFNCILNSPLEFIDLMSDSEEEMNFYLKNLSKTKPDDIFRSFHTLKARFANFSLSEIVNDIHEIETFLNEISDNWNELNKNQLRSFIEKTNNTRSNFIKENRRLIEVANSVHNNSGNGGNINELIKDIKTAFNSFNQKFVLKELSSIFNQFISPIEELARQQDKMVEINITESDIYLDPESYKELFSSFIHIFRNSIDHGIESIEERIAKNKQKTGILNIKIKKINSSFFEIIISDDGRGIDPKMIKEKISKIEGIKETNLEKLTDREILDFIFHKGFTTKEDINTISGRGVGMNSVKNEVEAIGGKIIIKSILGDGVDFIIKLPFL